MSDLRLVVGLGNPGKKYENMRHNLGFLAIAHLAKHRHLKITASSLCKGLVAEGWISEQECCLLLPLTFMNKSGAAVKKIVEKKEIALKNILVVCDDFNLDFGQLRLRRGGSDGGHNGLDSVIYHLGTEGFARLRIGIGSPKRGMDPADFVLEEFTSREKKGLGEPIQEATDCCLMWLTQGIEKAMGQFNKRKGNE